MNRLKSKMADVNINQEKSDAIVVTGLGMISSIGRDVVTSCASARAGITRESELDYFSVLNEDSDEFNLLAPVAAHAMTGFSEGFVRLGRLVRLGQAAIVDLLAYADIKEISFPKTGFFLNLSSGYYLSSSEAKEREEMDEPDSYFDDEPLEMDVRTTSYSNSLIPRLCELTGIIISDKFQKLYFRDHVGVIIAIRDAMNLLQTEELDRCIIGGIDSFVEQETLKILSEFDVIKTVVNPNGFIPGEAAAFILLERYDKALRRNARIEAIIESPSLKTEATHRLSGEPSAGVALFDAISETIKGLTNTGENTGLIIGDLNGDNWRAKEWGNALVKLAAKYPLGDNAEWYPAVSFGEIGAASGAVAICMGVRGVARGYAKTNNILIWMANDNGHKSSIYLRKHHR